MLYVNATDAIRKEVGCGANDFVEESGLRYLFVISVITFCALNSITVTGSKEVEREKHFAVIEQVRERLTKRERNLEIHFKCELGIL